MKKFLTIMAVMTAVATPVLAQAREFRAPDGTYATTGVPSSSQVNEEARYDHAKGDVAND